MGSRDHSITCETCGLPRGGMNDDKCACDRGHEAVAEAFVKALDALLLIGLELSRDGNPDLSRAREDLVISLQQMLTVQRFNRGLGASLSQLMRANTQMFEDTIRILGQQNQHLYDQVAALMAEVAKLRRDERPLVAAATFDKHAARDAVNAFDVGELSALALAGHLPGAIDRIEALEDSCSGALRMIDGLEQPGLTLQAIASVLRSGLARNSAEKGA